MKYYLILDKEGRAFAGFRPQDESKPDQDLVAVFRKPDVGAPAQICMMTQDDAIKVAASITASGFEVHYTEVK